MTSLERARPNASEALALLKEGNERFVRGVRSVEVLALTMNLAGLAAKGQKPFCIMLACSDSRIPTEILFDRGPGDLFVVRVAGNVATPALLGSIELAAESFGVPLCVVMGHTGCGAIGTTLERITARTVKSKNLKAITNRIEPAVRAVFGEENEHAHEHGHDPRRIDVAAALNVAHTLSDLRESSQVISRLVADGKLTLAGAICDTATGQVHFDLKRFAKGADAPAGIRDRLPEVRNAV